MIQIPRRLERKLKENVDWFEYIARFLRNVEKVFVDRPVFFPDYRFYETDHISTVLSYADHLIPDMTIRELSPGDIALLVGAATLHDIGMFLRPEEVRKILSGDYAHKYILGHHGRVWRYLWIDYIEEINRYPDEKMYYYFGQRITARTDCIEDAEMTDMDKRIVGEFLRRHHPAMAWEIACQGLPGNKDIELFEISRLDDEIRGMIGLLAWSHGGMPLQEAEEYILHDLSQESMIANVPSYYLMAVLRIADCLDVGEHRVLIPYEDRLNGLNQAGRINEQLWIHRIKTDESIWEMKTMRLRIEAYPRTSIEYMQLDRWLKEIQYELDQCLLHIAEKYDSNSYQLSIRHIVSNIQDPRVKASISDHSYLAREVRLAANPAFVRLILPELYENTPSYGVRELVQNAVDACIEREYAEHMRGNADYRGSIEVCLNTRERILTITDNGIGMNEDVLTNYLLSAGESYRASDSWQRDNIADNQPQIVRTGRFGIGFLSVFLLGNYISVETRHLYDEKGYQFEFNATSGPLNILRTNQASVGTTIMIELDDGVCEALDADTAHPWNQWYALDDPHIRYVRDDIEMPAAYTHCRGHFKNAGWFELESREFHPYLWKPADRVHPTPAFYCNGLRIYGGIETDLSIHGLNVPAPHVSLTDIRGALEVNLPRTRVLRFPEREALLREVFRYHIARLLTIRWENEDDYRRNLTKGFTLGVDPETSSAPFLLTRDGFTLNYVSVLSAMEIERYVALYYETGNPCDAVENACRFLREDCPVCIVLNDSASAAPVLYRNQPSAPGSAANFTEELLSGSSPLFNASVSGHGYTRYLTYIWLQDKTLRDIRTNHFPYLRINNRDTSDNVRTLDWLDGPLAISPEMPIDRKQFDPAVFPVAVQFDFMNEDYYSERYSDPNLLFPRMLRELLTPAPDYPQQNMWIPFDFGERIKKFPLAFTELAYYIDFQLYQSRF